MTVTMRQLLTDEDLHLRIVYDGGKNSLDGGVIWVHATDVVTAAEYSEPGEILLTCSTNFPLEDMSNANDLSLLKRNRRKLGLSSHFKNVEDAYNEMWMRYVETLSHAGIQAIGLGVVIKHHIVPKALLAAAVKYHIVLFEVPGEVSFSMIMKAFLRYQSEEEETAQRRMYSIQHEMFKALGSDNPLENVVSMTARLVGGWAAFVDNEGNVRFVSNRNMAKRAGDLYREFQKQMEIEPGDIHMMYGVTPERNRYFVKSLESGGRQLGCVMAASGMRSDNSEILRPIVAAASEAITCILPQLIERFNGISRLRTAVFCELAGGGAQSAMTFADELWPARFVFPAHVMCVAQSGMDASRLYQIFDREIPGDLRAIYAIHDGRLWIVVAENDMAWIRQWLAADASRTSVDKPVEGLTMLAEAFDEVKRNFSLREYGHRSGILDISPHELVRPDVAQAYATELLGPLRELPQTETNNLLHTMRELLMSAFNVGEAATHMHVHRHTVENRLRKVENLLGLDLSSESDRVKLWIACAFIRDSMSTSC